MDKMTKYGKPECERRFLLSELPDDVRASARVFDRYINGTRLRLRRIESLDGDVLQRKLGQKVRPDPSDPSFILHTTMYLTDEEYDVLATLPAKPVAKTRHLLDFGGIDVYEDGTIIHEVEFRSREEVDAYQPPMNVIREVTLDEAYTGFGLADS